MWPDGIYISLEVEVQLELVSICRFTRHLGTVTRFTTSLGTLGHLATGRVLFCRLQLFRQQGHSTATSET